MPWPITAHRWYAAYDDAFSDHGPGHICSLRTAEHADGIDRIELGKGPEDYKHSLASGSRPVAEGAVDLRPHAPLAKAARVVYRAAKDAVGTSRSTEPLRRVVRRVKNLAAGANGF